MQFRNVCALFVILAVCIDPMHAALEGDIVKLLEEFRARMCHPFTDLGIPALDPFKIEHQETYIDGIVLKNLSASVTNLRLTGLSDFIINQIRISLLSQRFTFDLTFPLTRLRSNYTAQGSIGYIVNLVGKDAIVGDLEELRIIITCNLRLGPSFGIRNLKIEFHVNNLYVDFGQLLEYDRLNSFLHNIINDLTLELLNDFWLDYGKSYTSRIEEALNQQLGRYSLSEILGIISGSGSGSIFGDDPPGDCKAPVEPSVIRPTGV